MKPSQAIEAVTPEILTSEVVAPMVVSSGKKKSGKQPVTPEILAAIERYSKDMLKLRGSQEWVIGERADLGVLDKNGEKVDLENLDFSAVRRDFFVDKSLRGLDLSGSELGENMNLSGTDLTKTELVGVVAPGIIFSRNTLQREGTKVKGTDLRGGTFDGMQAQGVFFEEGTRIMDAELRRANLTDACFHEDATIINTDTTGAILDGVTTMNRDGKQRALPFPVCPPPRQTAGTGIRQLPAASLPPMGG